MRRWRHMIAAVLTGVFVAAASMTAAADAATEVRAFPGWNGSGTIQTGPIAGSVSNECLDNDSDDEYGDGRGPGGYIYKRGWRYSPAGWWFQDINGNWPSGGWFYIDGRWYMINAGGHVMTGWYTDGSGNKFYLNPVDDGMYGSMRVGWQIIGGKAYYFNAMSDGTLGRLLVNTTTPDGYLVGSDGAMVLK